MKHYRAVAVRLSIIGGVKKEAVKDAVENNLLANLLANERGDDRIRTGE